jgi:hypothetical protein
MLQVDTHALSGQGHKPGTCAAGLSVLFLFLLFFGMGSFVLEGPNEFRHMLAQVAFFSLPPFCAFAFASIYASGMQDRFFVGGPFQVVLSHSGVCLLVEGSCLDWHGGQGTAMRLPHASGFHEAKRSRRKKRSECPLVWKPRWVGGIRKGGGRCQDELFVTWDYTNCRPLQASVKSPSRREDETRYRRSPYFRCYWPCFVLFCFFCIFCKRLI